MKTLHLQGRYSPQPIRIFPPAEHFNFLGLSAELRNRVYELVLKSDNGLRAFWEEKDDSPGKFVLHKDGEFNQLKYVSRQLYAETAGIEARFNMVEFLDDFEYEEPRDLLLFAKNCHPTKLQWFKKIFE